jgi:hypothetical protein
MLLINRMAVLMTRNAFIAIDPVTALHMKLSSSDHFMDRVKKRVNFLKSLSQENKVTNQLSHKFDSNNILWYRSEMMVKLKELFKTHPLLIFKDLESVSPRDFIHFVKTALSYRIV